MANIFVGNLSFTATRDDVHKLFSSFGTVLSVIITQKKKGKSRGFGFVTMPNEEEKNKAMAALQGKEFMGRPLVVTAFIPKPPGKFRTRKHKHAQGPGPVAEPKRYQRDDRSKPAAEPASSSRPFRGPAGRPTGRPERRPSAGGARPAPTPFAKMTQGQGYRKDERGPRPVREGGAKPYSAGKPAGKPYPSKPPYKKIGGPSKPAKPGGAFRMFYNGGKLPKI